MMHRDAGGFTVVELIAVMVLLGILAATATSRMVGRNAYAGALVSQQVIALGRLAQQTALARQDAVVGLDIDQNAGDWRFRVQVTVDGTTVASTEERAEISDTAVMIANGATTAPLGPAAALHLTFDGLGGLAAGSVSATTLDPAVGVGIQVVGDSTSQLCIGSAGHAYRGSCT